MSSAAAVIAALPREVAPLVRGWTQHATHGHLRVWSRGSVVVACAGMGPARAAFAVQAALAVHPEPLLYSVGLAGACDPALIPGALVLPDRVIDVSSGERFGGGASMTLVSSPALASVAEKRRLRASYGALAVDMEAATVARLARAHGLEFRAVKAISDGADFELRELGRFATADGQFREAAFAVHAALRPPLWPRLLALAANSKRAVTALTEELRAQLNLEDGERD